MVNVVSVLECQDGTGLLYTLCELDALTKSLGKTSCIIPMVAAVLADRKSLVRVIVPKALLQQTAELLQARLGGMLNRPLRHVPFAR